MKKVIPISEVNRRLPIMGRLRFGKRVPNKSGKGTHPVTTDGWLFTSADRDALERIAGLYGGEITPFVNGARGQLQVETNAPQIRVILPPDCLAESFYELWSGRGLLRKCNGLECTGFPEDAEPVTVPCVCRSSGKVICNPKTRLSVIVPQVGLGGVWRLDTGSEAALEEIPASVDLIRGASTAGFPEAVLSLQHRESKGGSQKFTVPVLTSTASFDQLAAGATGRPAIETPAPEEYAQLAEVIDDDEWA